MRYFKTLKDLPRIPAGSEVSVKDWDGGANVFLPSSDVKATYLVPYHDMEEWLVEIDQYAYVIECDLRVMQVSNSLKTPRRRYPTFKDAASALDNVLQLIFIDPPPTK